MAIPILGDLWGKIVDKGGDIISELVTDKDLAKELDHAFRTQMAKNSHDFEVLEKQLEADMFAAQQETIQAELHQSDIYTKRTRPKIATKSFYAGLAYVLMSMLPVTGITIPIPFTDGASLTILPWVYEWPVLMLLYSPALAYMGVRGFEKWKGGGVK